mmetsp:Transcript_76129/g.140120  ORF Transcript_76129/g.140120 Transcript_76129/m.140120 type:complete len:348 (+) Transcript_76129:193-1236(+)
MSRFHCENCLFTSCLELPKPCTDTEYCFSDQFTVDFNSEPNSWGSPNARHVPAVTGIPNEGKGNGLQSDNGEIRESNAEAIQSSRETKLGKSADEMVANTSAGVLASIDRCEEEMIVLTTLKQTAEVCLASVLSKEVDGGEASARTSELCVRVYEALAQDSGPTEGQDVYVRLGYAGKGFTTSRKASRPWATGTGGAGGRLGALHVTWNELYHFEDAVYSDYPGCLKVGIEREDGQELASAEIKLDGLQDQRVHHQWCTIGNGWRVYVACQYVRSAADMLQSHIREFEVRLQAADTTLTWLRSSQAEQSSPRSELHTPRRQDQPSPKQSNAADVFAHPSPFIGTVDV